MITLFGCAHFFNFVSFLLYPTDDKRLKCVMLGAFTCTHNFLSPLCIGAPEGQHSCIPHRPFPSLSDNMTEIDNEMCQTV